MPIGSERPRLVGGFIRRRREAAGLSQRALGLIFDPPVTTQFISNLERGVTPLPLHHVPTLTKALAINEAEIMTLLEQEYTLKLSGRLGGLGTSPAKSLTVQEEDSDFMQVIYNAYRLADDKTRRAFASICESVLNVSRKD